MFHEKISPELKYGLLGIITVIAIKDIFFKLFFIVWILRSYYLWKTTLGKEIYNEDFISKEFYKKTKENRRNVFSKNEKKGTVNNEELRNILIETGNLQHIMFKDLIRELIKEKVENIAKIQEFSGKDNKDPVEWIRKFNRTAEANNWKNEKKIAIAATHLTGIALEWYEREKENIQQWHKDEDNNSFEGKFIKELTTNAKKEKWMQELWEIKQGKGETVNTYEIRFKRLLNRVKDDIPEMNRVTLFTRGLIPEIYSLTVLEGRSTLEKVIDSAKRAEVSTNYRNNNSTKKGIVNKNKRAINKRRARQICNKCKKKEHISKECNKEKTKKRF